MIRREHAAPVALPIWARVTCSTVLATLLHCGLPARSRAALPLPRQPYSSTADSEFRSAAPAPRNAPAFSLPVVDAFMLQNGVTIAVVNRPAHPIASVYYVNRRGGDDDPAVESGIASITTDLLLRGAAMRSGDDIVDFASMHGLRLDSRLDHTASGIRLDMMAVDLPAGLGLLADIVRRPAITEAEFAVALHRHVQETRALAPMREGFLGQLVTGALMGDGHPLARPITGFPQSLQTMRRQHVWDFYASHFGPMDSAVIIVGAVTRAEIQPLVESAFQNWRVAAQPATRVLPQTAARTGPSVRGLTSRASDHAGVLIAFPGAPIGSPDHAACEVVNQILGGMFSSRLNHALREMAGVTYSVSSSYEAYPNDGLFRVTTWVESAQLGLSVAIILAEVARLRRSGVTEQELAAAVASLRQSAIASLSTNAGTAALLGRLFAEHRDLNDLALEDETRAAVTVADAHRVIRAYVAVSNAVLGIIAPRDVGDRALVGSGFPAIEWWQFNQ